MPGDSFYFKYVDVNINDTEINNFITAYPLLESRFELISVDSVRSFLPTISNWFKENKLEPKTAILINHSPGFKQEIHSDPMPNKTVLALNIPLNKLAEMSVTRIYDVIEDASPQNCSIGQQNLNYLSYNSSQVKKITEYTSQKPVLVNISKPHSAWNNTCHRRGVLTFRFKEDPWFLIN